MQSNNATEPRGDLARGWGIEGHVVRLLGDGVDPAPGDAQRQHVLRHLVKTRGVDEGGAVIPPLPARSSFFIFCIGTPSYYSTAVCKV
jgi:hypothetical protein